LRFSIFCKRGHPILPPERQNHSIRYFDVFRRYQNALQPTYHTWNTSRGLLKWFLAPFAKTKNLCQKLKNLRISNLQKSSEFWGVFKKLGLHGAPGYFFKRIRTVLLRSEMPQGIQSLNWIGPRFQKTTVRYWRTQNLLETVHVQRRWITKFPCLRPQRFAMRQFMTLITRKHVLRTQNDHPEKYFRKHFFRFGRSETTKSQILTYRYLVYHPYFCTI
jgi:hypothetical protein